MKLKKDDTVQVLSGDDAGKQGRIVKVDRKADKVIVQGVNIIKKAMRKRSQQDKGGIMEIEAPIQASNVNIVCKKCGPTKIATATEGKAKVRKCRKCGEAL